MRRVRWVWQWNWTHLGRHQTRPLGGGAHNAGAQSGEVGNALLAKAGANKAKGCKRDGMSLLSCCSFCSCLCRRCLVLNFTRISALPSSSHSFYAPSPPQPTFQEKTQILLGTHIFTYYLFSRLLRSRRSLLHDTALSSSYLSHTHKTLILGSRRLPFLPPSPKYTHFS